MKNDYPMSLVRSIYGSEFRFLYKWSQNIREKQNKIKNSPDFTYKGEVYASIKRDPNDKIYPLDKTLRKEFDEYLKHKEDYYDRFHNLYNILCCLKITNLHNILPNYLADKYNFKPSDDKVKEYPKILELIEKTQIYSLLE